LSGGEAHLTDHLDLVLARLVAGGRRSGISGGRRGNRVVDICVK
jgi:hypothetical protein